MLTPNLLPAHHSSHQRPCTEMTHGDRKLHQQGGLLFWEQPLRRIKGSQLLTLEEGTEKGTSPRGPLLDLKKKSLRPGDVFPSFSPAHELFLSRQGRGHLVGAFQEPHPTTPHSGKGLSPHPNPTCDEGWGWPRSNLDLACGGSEISQR